MFLTTPFSRRRGTSTPAQAAASRRLTLERLEERDVPAGIVSVFASQGSFAGTVNLVITGDDLDNQVDIVRESGQVKIIAQGTTVLHYNLSSNPGVSVTPTYTQITFDASGGIRDISITMGGGHDAVRVSAIGDHSFGNFGV
ncbi:MAG: IPT/TIG domain-containing protein, partial [Thermogemmata sp.]